MRNTGFSVRLRVSDALGREIHQMALRENRSQSSAISILVTEALTARRSAATEVTKLSRLAMVIRGDAEPSAQ
jgi:hypothetical protein